VFLLQRQKVALGKQAHLISEKLAKITFLSTKQSYHFVGGATLFAPPFASRAKVTESEMSHHALNYAHKGGSDAHFALTETTNCNYLQSDEDSITRQ